MPNKIKKICKSKKEMNYSSMEEKNEHINKNIKLEQMKETKMYWYETYRLTGLHIHMYA